MWSSILIIIFQPGSYLFTFVFHPAAAETFQELAVLLYQVPPPIRTGAEAGAKNTNKEYKIQNTNVFVSSYTYEPHRSKFTNCPQGAKSEQI